MEKKDQMNQNPEPDKNEEVQEAKPETVKETVKEVKPVVKSKTAEAILSEEEKKQIVNLVNGPASVEPKTKKSKVKPKKSKKQINKKLKEKILVLIHDNAGADISESGVESEKTALSSVSPAKKTQRLISDTQRQLILRLIRDVSRREQVSELKAKSEEEIDYEHLNKQELVEMLEDVVVEKDISQIKSKVARIKVAFYHRNKADIEQKTHEFVANGGKEEEYEHVPDPLEQRFHQAFSIYKHNKAKYAEILEKEKQVNLKKKLDILEELKELINSEETLKKTYDEFKILQDKWKEVGQVPVTELNNLWQNYHFLVEKFFDKVRINKELRDLDLKKNLEQKIALCEKAEELLLDDSVLRSFKLLQKYHDEWREIGPVPREQKDEVWERFKAATDKINQRRREHYKELHQEQQSNLKAKEVLCDQIEAYLEENEFSSIKAWQKATDKVNELLVLWKSIGRAPKVENDLIWKRFKTSLDQFYHAKRDFFSAIKEQQLENYNRKLDLCIRAEAIKLSNEWKSATRDLINLQKEWKEIGPVPRKYSDKIWKRFRAACDEFFKRKSDFYKDSHKLEETNLKKKRELIETINNFEIKADKKANMEALKSFQKQWAEIGHVPFQEKDNVYKLFRDAYDVLMGKLGISSSDMSASGFRNKIEVYKNTPDGEQRMLKERSQIMSKLNKLKDDINLWENNIGFFSNSKQSNVFKAEFEKKIERAKKELDLLKQKIKLIDSEL